MSESVTRSKLLANDMIIKSEDDGDEIASDCVKNDDESEEVQQKPLSGLYPMLRSDRKRALRTIVDTLREQKTKTQKDTSSMHTENLDGFGETSTTENAIDSSPQTPNSKPPRRRRLDRTNTANNNNNNGPISTSSGISEFALNNNNNNHVKNERLSPGTPDTSSRSRSVTPSSASHPDTPPAPENPMLPLTRNYSDFMRSLAAKYNNTNTNDYFSAARNGFPPPLDPRFKPGGFPNIIPNLQTPTKDELNKRPDFSSILSPFASNPMFPPLIDMSTTQTLIAMVRTAKEAELQGLLKNTKRQDTSSPLDLSAAAPPPAKRSRTKTPSSGASGIGGSLGLLKRDQSESPRLQEDVSNWTVDDVCNFVAGIDICAEYVQNFRDQRIDGAGLPLLTEEHLTTTMSMKLGPALKLRSILAKKLGSCSVCLHCTHCHNPSNSPEPGNATGNTSDSGGTS